MNYDFDALIKEYFWFLVEDFGFSLEDRTFSSDELEIQITLEREPPAAYLPGLYFARAGEVDCPRMPFDWILYYLEDEKPQLSIEGKSLEENMAYFADLLREHGPMLFSVVDRWWIPALKYRLRVWEEKYHTAPIPTFKKIYDYIEDIEAGGKFGSEQANHY